MIENKPENRHIPKILAPAGNRASFLAAIAAGADAIYCGLKLFSARMEADNFGTEELSALTELAHGHGVQVYITLNSVLKPDDVDKAFNLVDKLVRHVGPDALIIADLAFVPIAREAGFKGEIHLSTLANMSFPKGLALAHEKLGISRVVLPRELSVDEIKLMAEGCPPGLDLEVFIHGALCYGVSGRCYWSSFLGGKSSLRGRCVQPCRRVYRQNNESKRFFSCQDLSLDVLVKVLLSIPRVSTWKIEGRKKGPHYVYYTVKAYQMLRDQGQDPQAKKTALGLLSQALGRPVTHYGFLSQRPQNPVNTDIQTGSGLLVGSIKGSHAAPYLIPRIELMAGDLLRIGYEDAEGHAIQKVFKSVPKKGRLHLKFSGQKSPAKDSPVFLIDRREKELEVLINGLSKKLEAIVPEPVQPSTGQMTKPGGTSRKKSRGKGQITDIRVMRQMPKRIQPNEGLWLSEEVLNTIPGKFTPGCWWWLPPVIWPDDEARWAELIERTLKKGGRNFVLNAPSQISFFPRPESLDLWAGPYCNISNAISAQVLASMGFKGIFASQELSKDDYLDLASQSPLPLGIILSGHVPMVISRTLHPDLKAFSPFTSPKGEDSWAARYGSDVWIYPNWILDLNTKKDELIRAGYTLFAHMDEHVPPSITLRNRPGTWNWDLKLL
ncbi:MAG: U32 family peptidase [Proteobacteria bacterium]|nr:U32 family peptidase [Pseudomonadota bacterium]